MSEYDELLAKADAFVAGDERRAGPVLVADLAAAVRRLSDGCDGKDMALREAVADLRRSTAIVRDLAAEDPVRINPAAADPHYWCTVCGGTRDPEAPATLDAHMAACPWRRAVEWVRDTDQETT